MNEYDKFMNENMWSIVSFIFFECILLLIAAISAIIGVWGFFAAILVVMIIPILWAIVFLLIIIAVLTGEKVVDKSSESGYSNTIR